ncbi:MAG: Ig domain-containing protein, partial [Gemmatimonadetes bacterium]|nr:Ig domain-containing protein [Gemmatimonadota bacterium]
MSYPHQVGPRNRAGSSAVRRFSLGALLLLTPVFAACDAGISAIEPAELPSSIELSTMSLDLAGGDTARVVATLLGASGRPIASPSAGALKPGVAPSGISWTSSDKEIVDVTRSGLVHAKGNGDVTITASSGNLRATSRVKVTGNTRQVIVSPRVDTLSAIEQALRLSATVYNSNGQVVGGSGMTWASLDEEVATVDGRGTVRAIAVGVALITVTAGGGADTATIHVRQAVSSVQVTPGSTTLKVGEAQSLTATVTDANGYTVPDAAVNWTSSNTSVAVVNGAGSVSAKAGGSATIRATAAGMSGSAPVTVATKATLASPPPSSSASNEPAGFSAISNQTWETLPSDPGNSWGWNANTHSIIVDDRSAPMPGGKVFRSRVYEGQDGTGTHNTWYSFPEEHQGYSELYFAAWYKFPKEWRNHGGGTKQLWPGYDGVTNQLYTGFSRHEMRPQVNLQGQPWGNRNHKVNMGPASHRDLERWRDEWVRLEYYVKMNTTNSLDGDDGRAD